MSLSHVGRVVLRSETLPGKQGYVFQWRRQFFNHCSFPGLEGSGVVLHCHASNDLCGTDQMMYTQDRKKKKSRAKRAERRRRTHTHTHTHTHMGQTLGRGSHVVVVICIHRFLDFSSINSVQDLRTSRHQNKEEALTYNFKDQVIKVLWFLACSVSLLDQSLWANTAIRNPYWKGENKRLPDITQ